MKREIVSWEALNDKSYKKYRVHFNDNSPPVKFGDRRYGQYRDRTPLRAYSHLDHNDPARRRNYRKRHGAIMTINTKDGKPRPAHKVRFSAAWFSWHYLW